MSEKPEYTLRMSCGEEAAEVAIKSMADIEAAIESWVDDGCECEVEWVLYDKNGDEVSQGFWFDRWPTDSAESGMEDER